MSQWQKAFPMWLTYSRVFFAMILFISLWEGVPHRFLLAMCFFLLGALTDWLDGQWARRYGHESLLGQFMDPVTDKILMLAALLCLLELGAIEVYMLFIIVSRDIVVGALRALAAANNVIVAARSLGKWKTFVQMVAVPCIFWARHTEINGFELVGYWMLWGSVVLSLLAATDYLAYYKRISKSPKP